MSMDGAKARYIDLTGHEQTAYIDQDFGTYGVGVHKHTDEPVCVQWGDPHREIPTPEGQRA